jgi:hypothetical protein
MPSSPKFPPSAEIKRVIGAAIRVGIEIGTIEIHPDKIVIYQKEKNDQAITAYDFWKMHEGKDTDRARHTDNDSDALLGKPKG